MILSDSTFWNQRKPWKNEYTFWIQVILKALLRYTERLTTFRNQRLAGYPQRLTKFRKIEVTLKYPIIYTIKPEVILPTLFEQEIIT